MLRGDPSQVAAAGKIGLGQLSTPGQKAVLDRPTILSRLASHGIPAEQVRLTGAETVAVRRFSKTISTEEFVEVGQHVPPAASSGPDDLRDGSAVKPKDLILSEDVEDLQVTPRFVRTAARGFVDGPDRRRGRRQGDSPRGRSRFG